MKYMKDELAFLAKYFAHMPGQDVSSKILKFRIHNKFRVDVPELLDFKLEERVSTINQCNTSRKQNKFKIDFPLPKIIRENLLTGEDCLIPRTRINMTILIIHKVIL